MNTRTEKTPQVINDARLHWPASGRTTIPFSRGTNHILIEVNGPTGEIFTFFVDTGASLTVVTPGFVERGEISERSSETCADAHGASGRIAGVSQLVRVHNLSIGTLLVDETTAVVIDLASITEEIGAEIHGIVGFNLLSRMTTVIDYQNNKITFTGPGNKDLRKNLGEPAATVPFALRMGALIEVIGHVNEAPATAFIVDIGSRYSALNRMGSEVSGIKFEPLAEQPSALGLGEKPPTPVRIGWVDVLRFGDLTIAEPRLYSLDLPVFSKLGLDDRNAGLLGNDLLSRFTVAIDYATERLSFWSPHA